MNPAPEAPDPAAPPASLRTALRRLLRPLVRLLVDQRLTFPQLSSLLKEIYVEVAERDYALESKRTTTTRVSLLTGIHRKDVRRLRETDSAEESAASVVSFGAQLVARWLAVDEFRDAAGRPRPLPRRASADEPSFDSLVSSVSTDIRPRAVLDEWLRLGIVRLDDEQQVHLNTGAFVPQQGFDEKAFFFGRNLRDHIAAGVHNLAGGRPPMPDRSVYYDGLSEESVAELQALSARLGDKALHTVNRRALELQSRDREAGAGDQRVNFGFYVYRGDEEESS